METYNGHVKTPADAIILFEACRLGHLPRVQRRLSEKERQLIKSGSVFVWDEREAGMRRWTDGKSWSASRVSGSFLTYREMEGKRGGSTFSSPQINAAKRNANGSMKEEQSGYGHSDMDTTMGDDGPDGYRYKPDGLMKQSFSITTASGQHLHLISYFARSHPSASNLPQPTSDPTLRHIRPLKGMYPETTVQDAHHIPPITRSPMMGSPYASSPSSMPTHGPGYPRQNPAFQHPLGAPPSYGYMAPPSPMQTTPQPSPHYYPYAGSSHRGPPSATSSPSYYPQPPGYQHHTRPPPGPTAFDRAPPPISSSSLPPPPLPPHNSYTSHPSHQYPPSQSYQHSHHHSYQQPPPLVSYTSSPALSHSAGSSAQDPYRQPYNTSNPGGSKIDPRLTTAPHQPLNQYHRNDTPRSTLPNGGHRSLDSSNSGPPPTKMIPSIGSLINSSPPPSSPSSNHDAPIEPPDPLKKPGLDPDQRALRQLDRAFVP